MLTSLESSQHSRGGPAPIGPIHCDTGYLSPAVRCIGFRSTLTINVLTRYLRVPLPYHRIVLDLTSENAFTARPVFEIPLLGTLTVVWLGETCRHLSPVHGLRSYRLRAILYVQHSTPSRHQNMRVSRTVQSFLMVSSEIGALAALDHSTHSFSVNRSSRRTGLVP